VVGVGCTGLFVVAKTKSCGFGTGVHIAPAMFVLMSTETIAEHLFSASRANTFNFKSLNVSNISLGNGMPSSFGHSRSSRRQFSSICSGVTVSGSDQCGAVRTVAGF
jgi:hypothetical protein